MAETGTVDDGTSRNGWLDRLTKVAAVAGSIVALGQAGSTWIDGHYKDVAEQEKTQRELALAEVRERSAMAESYLKLILAKDTPPDGRAILYSALAQLKGHPLQAWAQARYEASQKGTADLARVYDDEVAVAARRTTQAESTTSALEAEIAVLSVKFHESMEDPPRAEALHQQLVAKSQALAKARAEVTVAQLSERATKASSTTPSTASKPAAVAAVTSTTDRVTAALLKPLFSAKAAPNIDAGAPYLRAALQEFGVTDPRAVAAIIATIATETPDFDAYEEPVSAGASYEGRAALGNTSPGDGVRYRGRGYLGLTGRANYAKVSAQLGLGTRLLYSPEDAKSPEVASRILVSWLVKDGRLQALVDRGDLAGIRRMVSGGSAGLDRFTAAYRKTLAALGGAAGA